MGFDQTQRPFVQGLIVGPTPNPLFLRCSRRIRFSKNDLPVLYLPATEITPILSLPRLVKSSWAYGATWNPIGVKLNGVTGLLVVGNELKGFSVMQVGGLRTLAVAHFN